MASGIDNTIFPIILAVPESVRKMPPRERVRELSLQARRALSMCARKIGVVIGELEKDANGAPLPFGGNFWSLSHTRTYVGAVICAEATGIDVEAVQDVSEGLIRKVGREKEWRLSADDPAALFFRYWTAKEAVLKAVGVGISRLSGCRVVEILGDRHLVLTYEGITFLVEHFFFDGHVACVVKNKYQVAWSLLNQD